MRTTVVAVALIVASIVTTGLMGVTADGAENAGARGTAPPSIELVRSPRLFVTTASRVRADQSVAWVVFRTRKHLHVTRQVVARVRDTSGRSFAAGGARNCVRATIVSRTAGAPDFKAGQSYRVQLFARASTGAPERALFYDNKLTARRFAATAPRAPTCGSR